MTALAGAASAAVAANRLGAAFRLNEQLESALGRLDDLTNPRHPSELQQQVAVAWADVGGKAKAATKATEALTTATNALHEADAAVKADDGTRESAIDQQIATLEQQWAAKPSSSKSSSTATQTTAGADRASDTSEATA